MDSKRRYPASFLAACAIGLFLFVPGILGQTPVPRFDDYPIRETFTGKTAPLVLSRAARAYRTRLREAAREKPNFAGHFIVTTWGCGTECVTGAIIDAKTGRVFMLPTTLCCWGAGVDNKFNPVEFRLNSNLIVLSGARNEKEGDEATRFYKFERNQLALIRSIPRQLLLFLAPRPALGLQCGSSAQTAWQCAASPLLLAFFFESEKCVGCFF